jgi:hypothetical protein
MTEARRGDPRNVGEITSSIVRRAQTATHFTLALTIVAPQQAATCDRVRASGKRSVAVDIGVIATRKQRGALRAERARHAQAAECGRTDRARGERVLAITELAA